MRVYCDQFGRSVEERLRGATLVPLPLTVAPINQGVEGNPIPYASDKWCSTLIETLRNADSVRVGVRARSGAGKTILSLLWMRLGTGLKRAVRVKTRRTDSDSWGGPIGLTWMTGYWATLIPMWVYYIVRVLCPH